MGLSIGRRIRALRVYHVMPAKKLAQKVLCSWTTLVQIERERAAPNLRFLQLVAKVFDVPLGYLLQDDYSITDERRRLEKLAQMDGELRTMVRGMDDDD